MLFPQLLVLELSNPVIALYCLHVSFFLIQLASHLFQQCALVWKLQSDMCIHKERKTERETDKRIEKVREDKSVGSAGYNRKLRPLRKSQHTKQRSHTTPTRTSLSSFYEKTTKQDKIIITPQRKRRRVWRLFLNCKTVITQNPGCCCLKHSNNKSRQHHMTSHIFCFVQAT